MGHIRTLEVSITQEHIDEGTRNHCQQCPVALAINEALGDAHENGGQFADVVTKTAYIRQRTRPNQSKVIGEISLPKSMEYFIADFDFLGREAVKPFTTTLEVYEYNR